ncbi:MAG: hypothetical protein RSE24_03455, partial [Oscillospiraceae bacterium]
EMVDTTTGITVFPTTIITPNVGEITGAIKPAKQYLNLEVYYGDNLQATTDTDAQGNFAFYDLPYGVYRLVVKDSDRVITHIFEVKSGAQTAEITFPSGKANTVVEQKPNTPPIAANIPLEIFTQTSETVGVGITAAEKAILDAGGTIEIKLTAQAMPANAATDDREKIMALISGNANSSIGLFLDLKVTKTVTDTNSPANVTTGTLTQLASPIKIVIEVPKMYQGRTNDLKLFRVHNDVAQEMSKTGTESYRFINVGGIDYIELIASRFSSYAIVYTAPSDGNGGNGGNTDEEIVVPEPVPAATQKPLRKPRPTAKPTIAPTPSQEDDKDKNDKTEVITNGKGAGETDNKDGTEEIGTTKSYKCKLCHHCQTFMGLCIWIWFAIALLITAVAVWIILRRKNDEDDTQDKQ